MPLLAHTPDRYLHAVQLDAGDGGPRLYAVAVMPDGERLLTVSLSARGEPQGEILGARHGAIVGLGPTGEAVLPRAQAPRAASGRWSAWVERDGYCSAVMVSSGGQSVAAWRAQATAAAPCVAVADGGAWLAFHHNLREDTGEPDLPKWIALRFVTDQGEVLAPVADMVDRDRDREGEEQSFEFPTIVVGPDGAIALFGRGSHCHYRQDVNATGFAPRRPLDDGAWGCRGRRVVAVLTSDGVVSARRVREGIDIALGSIPAGGPPVLTPCEANVAGGAPTRVPQDPRPDPAAVDGLRTLFGDLHQHSAHSDGLGTADEPYLRARHVYGDDFCALTDHEAFLGKRIGAGEWAYLQAVAESHDDPGHFATLIAYEWTGRMHPGPGHKVVYLPRAGLPIISRDEVPDGAELVRRVAAMGGFSVPHHVGWTGADEVAHDPDGQPVWEICSCHGCYESYEHVLGQRGDLRDQMIDAVVGRGLRFGFIACSDGHGLLWHHGVARKRDAFRTGLTAVQARSCTRASVLEALRNRRCYATSGERILLDLRAGGMPMGSILRGGGAVDVVATAHGTDTIARMELVGGTGVLASVEPDDDRGELAATVRSPHVYLRVVQANGEMAWSSPIFCVPE